MLLSRLLYVSQTTQPMSRTDLTGLASFSAARNAVFDITGILLYSGGYFIQLLEGAKPLVTDLYPRIVADPRHKDVEQLLFEAAPSRIFTNWNMGLLNLDDGPVLQRMSLMSTIDDLRAKHSRSSEIAVALLREFRKQLPAVAA